MALCIAEYKCQYIMSDPIEDSKNTPKLSVVKTRPPKPTKYASYKMAPPKPHRKSSNIASNCVYLLETDLGNMKDVEDHGTNNNVNELNDIYDVIRQLNARIIELK